MAFIFISNIVPDRKEYWNNAFTRAGNNVFLGMTQAFPTDLDVKLWSCRPSPSYPKAPLWLKGHNAVLDNGRVIHFIPTLNIKFIKNIVWAIICFFKIIWWRLTHLREECTLLTYNNDPPPIEALYFACRLCRIKIYGMLYDLGVPPKNLNISKATRLAYRYMDKTARFAIKRLDGRIIINELIARDYAPGKDYLLVDGGVSQHIIDHLFPLRPSESDEYVMVLAGMLWENNGTRLILEALELNKSNNLRVFFAGHGQDVELIKERAKNDSRIEYVGMLNIDELFQLYSKADVLLNLRIEDTVDYHFPSKLLEYMTTGRYVISTSIAHAARDYGQYLCILDDVSGKGLAECWDRVMKISKEELCEKGKREREFMLTHRTWKKRTEEILTYMNLNKRDN